MRIHVAREAVDLWDLRQSFDGLCAITRDVLQFDPFTGHLFVFCNRRDRIKLLLWERNGFWWLYQTNCRPGDSSAARSRP